MIMTITNHYSAHRKYKKSESSQNPSNITEQVSVMVTLYPYVREIPGSNFSRETNVRRDFMDLLSSYTGMLG
jgi:hypothetical protein